MDQSLYKKLAKTSLLLSFLICAASCLIQPAFCAYPTEDTPSLSEQQQEHNEQPQNASSALHDTQPRPQSNTNGTPVVHRSRPAPDKTMWESHYESIGLTKQHRENLHAAPMGNVGWNNIYSQNAAAYPPSQLTNSHFAAAAMTWADAALAIGSSPQNQIVSAIANMQNMMQGAANAGGSGTLNALKEALAVLAGSNINVANEAAGRPGDIKAPFRPVSQAIWMVQQMFHHVYMPVAVLMLLPGALLLNLKVLAARGAGLQGDEDSAAGPFSAILRTIIAVFLIPATQLIMSYSIDIGNSMTFEAAKQIPLEEIFKWASSQYQNEQSHAATAAASQGGDPRLAPQPYMHQTFKAVMNLINMSLGYGLLILMAFQTVVSCYLLLLGPIAASFYAWPGGVGRLFRTVFANWVDAVVNISLWRFWWTLLVLCAITRIQWLRDIGEYVPNTEWEALMFTCFLVMMSYVPFMPFELRPGELVDKLLAKAKESTLGGGGGSPAGNGGGMPTQGVPPPVTSGMPS